MSEKNSGSGFLVISYICLEDVDEGVTKRTHLCTSWLGQLD